MTQATALAVDLAGLRQLVERRGKSFAIMELIQNAWDEDGVERVEITMRHLQPGRVQLTIEDDAPEGFHDLSHVFTLFAPSRKKGNAEKRGRFNLGEKLVIALCNSFSVETTKGSVEIDVIGNSRRTLRRSRARGSVVNAILRMNRDEMAEAIAAFRTLIPPVGTLTTLNGEELPQRTPVTMFDATLATEIADAQGFLRPSKRLARVQVFTPMPGEIGALYEMGIPVVETGDTYHVNVLQKVPLNVDRDNVPPAFLRDVRALVLNEMAPVMSESEASSTWVNEAMEDSLVTGEAVTAVLDRRFGEKRVVYDPSDLEANRIAMSTGFQVVPSNTFSREAWDNVRASGALLPAGRVTPSPKPFSEDGKPLTFIDPDDYTEEMREFIAACQKLHVLTVGEGLAVRLTRERSWQFAACYGSGEMFVNVSKVRPNLREIRTLRTVLHEFGHYYGDHLTHAFDDGIALVAARALLNHFDVFGGSQ